jgi:DNA-binding XRE family transcriptional regulator
VKNSVRDLRAPLSWTQAELAQKLGYRGKRSTPSRRKKTIPACRWHARSPKIFRKPVEEIFKA